MSNYWVFQIEMKGLRTTQKHMLEHDIGYFKWNALDESYAVLCNLKKQRGWKAKIIQWSKKNALVDIVLLGMESHLETVDWENLELIKYRIQGQDTVILTIAIDTQIFELWTELKKNAKFFMAMPTPFRGFDKETILKRFKDEVVKNYSKDYTIKEIESF